MNRITLFFTLLFLFTLSAQIQAFPIETYQNKEKQASSKKQFKAFQKNKKKEKRKQKRVGWSNKLKVRLLASILKKQMRKAIKKGEGFNQSLATKATPTFKQDSISIGQLLSIKNRDLAKVLGLRNSIRTRAMLNMMRKRFKKMVQSDPDILKESLAKTDLKIQLENAELLEAEIANYAGLASMGSLLLAIILQSGLFIWAIPVFLLIGIVFGIIAIAKGQNAGCLSVILAGLTVSGLWIWFVLTWF